MKATVDAKVRTLVEVRNALRPAPIPPGTEGYVVEAHAQPREGYDIEVKLADEDYEAITLYPDEFELIEETRS